MNRNARAGTAQSEIRHQTWRWEKVTREGEKPETEKRQKWVEIGREDRQEAIEHKSRETGWGRKESDQDKG